MKTTNVKWMYLDKYLKIFYESITKFRKCKIKQKILIKKKGTIFLSLSLEWWRYFVFFCKNYRKRIFVQWKCGAMWIWTLDNCSFSLRVEGGGENIWNAICLLIKSDNFFYLNICIDWLNDNKLKKMMNNLLLFFFFSQLSCKL